MNKKGFTTVELITSFTLATVVMLILFNVIIIMKDKLSETNIKTKMLVEKDNLSYNLNKRFKEKELSSITMCGEGDKCYEFTYSDDTSDKLIYSNIDKTITFNNYTFDIIDGITVEEPVIKEYYDTMSSTKYNGYFIIHIPIKIDNKDYSIKVNKYFNTDSLVIEIGNYYDNDGNKYTKVEYLESTGTQYIDTEIYPKSTTIQDILFSLTEMPLNNTQWRNGWGSRGSQEAFEWGVLYGKFMLNVSSNTEYIYSDIPFDLNKHSIHLESGKIEFDNTIYGTTTIGNTAEPNQSIYLFALHAEWMNPQIKDYCKERIYSTKIYDNDTLVRDYVPVIDSSSRPCLFDKVEKKCYYNQGTGEFLYG